MSGLFKKIMLAFLVLWPEVVIGKEVDCQVVRVEVIYPYGTSSATKPGDIVNARFAIEDGEIYLDGVRFEVYQSDETAGLYSAHASRMVSDSKSPPGLKAKLGQEYSSRMLVYTRDSGYLWVSSIVRMPKPFKGLAASTIIYSCAR